MTPFSPIAIVGRACLLPGVRSPDDLWQAVVTGKDLITSVPGDRWGMTPADVMCDGPQHSADRTWSDRGGYVRDFAEIFDPEGFAVPAAEVTALDPVFQWTLHTARLALRDAGHQDRDPARYGAVFGNLSFPSAGMAAFSQATSIAAIPGFAQPSGGSADPPDPRNRFSSGLPALLLERGLGLGAGAFALDAACASSLYAVKLACDRLHDGAADLMLAGAVNCADDLCIHLGFAALRALSSSGRSRPFHRDADGLVPAEGCGFVALRRLDDAVRDGDTIHGIIRGVGLSNDGRGRGLLVPSSDGQARAMRRALELAGLGPRDISLLECHATGTQAGDATEVRSVAEVYSGVTDLPIGSLKSNVGHLIAAAGIAGLIKMTEAMRHEVRPPTMHVEEPLDAIAGSPLRLLTDAEAWDRATTPDGILRAGVSAFGFGGNNAHLIVEEPGSARALARDFGSGAADGAPKRVTPKPIPLAVVGVGIIAASAVGRRAFTEAVLGDTPCLDQDGAGRTPPISLRLSQQKFPPNDLKSALAQQLAIVQVTTEATETSGSLPWASTGVYVGMGVDPEAARFGIRWRVATLARQWDCPPEWLEAAREQVGPVLDAAGVLGTMPNIVANRLNSQFDISGASFTVSSEERSGLDTLELAARALRTREIDAAVVAAVDMSCDPVHRVAAAAVLPGDRQIAGDAAVALVLKRLDDAERDGNTVFAVLPGTRIGGDGSPVDDRPDLRLGIGTSAQSLTHLFGHAHAASGLVHVAAAVLALHHRVVPGGAPLLASNGECGTGLATGSGPRTAAVEVDAMDGIISRSVLLAEAAHHPAPARETPPRLHVFSGNSPAEVLTDLEARRESTTGGTRLVVVAENDEQLADRAIRARRHIEDGYPSGEGVHYREHPIDGELAFVFTAAGAAYHGMGAELLRAIPEIIDPICSDFPVGEVAGWVFDAAHEPTPSDYLWATAMLSQAHARLTRQLLGLTPRAAIGYSSGESNSLYAFGIWADMDAMRREIDASGLMERELGVEFRAVARAWGAESAQWAMWNVLAPLAEVREAIAGEERVHLAIINTGDDVVIGGDTAACRRVVETIGPGRCRAVDYNLACHVPEVAAAFHQPWIDIHTRDVTPMPDLRHYSNGVKGSYVVSTAACADAITTQAETTLDFPATIRAAYADGVRVFVEHGPGGACTNFVREILCDSDVVAVQLDRRGRGVGQLFEAVAALVAAGVDVDHGALTRRLTPEPAEPEVARGPLLSVPSHPTPVRLPALPGAANRVQETDGVAGSYQLMAPAPALPSALDGVPAAPARIASAAVPTAPAPAPTGPAPAAVRVDARPAERVVIRADAQPAVPHPDPQPAISRHDARYAIISDGQPAVARAPVARPAAGSMIEAGEVAASIREQMANLVAVHRSFLEQRSAVHEQFLTARSFVVDAPVLDPGGLTGSDGATPVDSVAASAIAPGAPEQSSWLNLQQGESPSAGGKSLRGVRSTPAHVHPEPPRGNHSTPEPTADPEPPRGKRSTPEPTADPEPPRRATRDPAAPGRAEPSKPHFEFTPSGPVFDKQQLQIHSSGRISDLFGPLFETQDAYEQQCRMPEPPLLLADRVVGLAAECGVLGQGNIWTQTDVENDSWYLNGGYMPAGFMIEAGQADLMLISYMGIDLLNEGTRVYRLLGCTLTYHGDLPSPGQTLEYEIRITGHARHGEVRLFFFEYDCISAGAQRLSVRGGQAGFFSRDELENALGVLWTPASGGATLTPDDRVDPAVVACTKSSFSREEVIAFSEGRVLECFGPGFEWAQTHTRTPKIQAGRQLFIDRVPRFEPHGGPWQRGFMRCETSIADDAWFFDGHFKNDPCMPGNFMVEACIQALSFYLAALGHTTHRDGWRFQPLPEHPFELKCRGEINPRTELVAYEVHVTEIWSGPHPTIIGDVIGYVDGRMAFHANRIGVELTPDWPLTSMPEIYADVVEPTAVATDGAGFRFDWKAMISCAWGRPSDAFGSMFDTFENTRRPPRLPGPPYHFISRITSIKGGLNNCVPGMEIVSEYDIPPDAWYFDENGAETMPFAVLLEAGLQPCGWVATAVGSTTGQTDDLLFRNLDGTGVLLAEITRTAEKISTRVRLTNVSRSGGIIIESFDVECSVGDRRVFTMDTVFGFFPPAAFENQVGLAITEGHRHQLALTGGGVIDLTERPERFCTGTLRLAEPMLLMIDRAVHIAGAGDAGLGVVRGEKDVDPAEWFFKAHFFQDPVQPGSLGLEALLQLLQFYLLDTDMGDGVVDPRFEPLRLDAPMTWKYRGQVTPGRTKITTVMEITEVGADDRGPFVVGTGSLWCDELRIYQVSNMGMRVVSGDPEPATRRRSAPLAESGIAGPGTSLEIPSADVAAAVRDFWRRTQGVPARWLGDDLIIGLLDRYVHRVIVSGGETLARLQGRSAIFLANHQVQIESIIIGSVLPALTGVSMTTVSNAKHEQGWIGQLVGVLEGYPDSRPTSPIAYFDRSRPSSMFEIIARVKDLMSAGAHSFFVHTDGTRARSCREEVTRCSSVVLDLALEMGVPIVPVRFVGGLPVDPIEGKAEFPVGHGSQDYWIGEPIEAAELDALGLRDRVERVLTAINSLGVANREETPLPPDPEMASRVRRWQQRTGVGEAFATAWQVLDQLQDPSEETLVLRDAASTGHYRSDGTPRGDWLSVVGEKFFGPRGPEVGSAPAEAGSARAEASSARAEAGSARAADPTLQESARLSIKVNQSTHPQLADHAIGGVPVVPVAYAVEWFARAAAACAPSLRLVELSGISVLKGLLLTDDDLDLVVNARILTSAAHECTVRLDLVDATTGRAHYRCTATLSDANEAPSPAPPRVRTAAGGPPRYGTDVLFHGPAFQVIDSVAAVSTGLVATVRSVAQLSWPAEPWVTDPALIDGSLQLALLWTEQLLGAPSLPTGIGRVRLFGGAAGVPGTATLTGRRSTATRVVCDVLLADQGGAVIGELEGIEIHALPSTLS